jgi:Zn-finger nucleic acid-binding protein
MQNETNRPEEKFDERANEDSFFALKEHELLEQMRTEYQKAELSKRAARIVRCPKCAGKLAGYKFMEFVLERCDSCAGIWLDNGELEGILRSAARGPLGAFLDRCFSRVETSTNR